jgi:hypothetical protein
MAEISLRVVPDGDGVWRIHLKAGNERFTGEGWTWGDPASLLDLAAQLTAYPLQSPAALRLGYNDLQGDDLMLSLVLQPVGNLGAIEARVEIADADDPSCRLKGKLRTTYAALDRFVPQLRGLAAGSRQSASLEAD